LLKQPAKSVRQIALIRNCVHKTYTLAKSKTVMTQRVDRNSRNHKRWTPTISTIRDRIESRIASENAPEHSRPAKLIPWEDIWTSLRIARMRGNGEMIEVFYDVLFKEAVFDDRGAWSWDLKKSF
jgi:hypothetical protein